MFDKSGERKPRSTLLSVRKASFIIVLSGLRHNERTRRNFFASDILRHSVQNRLSDFRKFAERIGKHFSIRRFGKIKGRCIQPVLPFLRRAFPAGISRIEFRYGMHTPFSGAHGAALLQSNPAEFRRKRCIGAKQAETEKALILLGYPKTEARCEIMVAGNFIVEAKAFRTMTDKPRRDPPRIFGKFFRHHRAPAFLPKGAGKLKSFHKCSPPRGEALPLWQNSRKTQTTARIWNR